MVAEPQNRGYRQNGSTCGAALQLWCIRLFCGLINAGNPACETAVEAVFCQVVSSRAIESDGRFS